MFLARRMPDFEKGCCAMHVCMNYEDGCIPFPDENAAREFYPIVASAAAKNDCYLLTGSVMITHYHFLLGSRFGFRAISNCMRTINLALAWIFRKRGFKAPFFMGRPKFAPIHTPFELIWVAIYIHRNGERDGHSKCASLEREFIWGPVVFVSMEGWRYFTTLGRDELRILLSCTTPAELSRKCRDFNATFLKVSHRFWVQPGSSPDGSQTGGSQAGKP